MKNSHAQPILNAVRRIRRAVGRIQECDPPNEEQEQKPESLSLVSLPTRLKR